MPDKICIQKNMYKIIHWCLCYKAKIWLSLLTLCFLSFLWYRVWEKKAITNSTNWTLLCCPVKRSLPWQCSRHGPVPESGRSPEEGNTNQPYYCIIKYHGQRNSSTQSWIAKDLDMTKLKQWWHISHIGKQCKSSTFQNKIRKRQRNRMHIKHLTDTKFNSNLSPHKSNDCLCLSVHLFLTNLIHKHIYYIHKHNFFPRYFCFKI